MHTLTTTNDRQLPSSNSLEELLESKLLTKAKEIQNGNKSNLTSTKNVETKDRPITRNHKHCNLLFIHKQMKKPTMIFEMKLYLTKV